LAGARKIWRLPPHDPETVQRYARAAGVSPTVAMLLLNRRVTDPAHAQKFLDAPLIDLHPPQLLPDVPGAAALILNAVERKQSIVVYGDYDADGVTGTAILLQLFQHLGATASYYVPHRLEEGYGLNCDALTQLKQTGADLVISVDCGIASLAEAEHARSLGGCPGPLIRSTACPARAWRSNLPGRSPSG
jgi:single-stranded-DNA-specific exonuclease